LADQAPNPRQQICSHAAMLARIKRFDLSVAEMVALAIVAGLLTALFIPVSVG
jgi:hypothetical protein